MQPCSTNGEDEGFAFHFDFASDDGRVYIRYTKDSQDRFLGFDPNRKFARLKLYKNGSFNPTLSLWNCVFGFDRHWWYEVTYGNYVYLKNPTGLLRTDFAYLKDSGTGTDLELGTFNLISNGITAYEYEWIIRSQRVKDYSYSDDSKYKDCLKYGETFYLQANSRITADAGYYLKNDATVDLFAAGDETDFAWSITGGSSGTCVENLDQVQLSNGSNYLSDNSGVIEMSSTGYDWSVIVTEFPEH